MQEWTDLNAVVYYGNAEDRKAIRELEFVYGLDMPATQSERITSLKRCHPSADKSNKSRPASIMKHSVTHLDEKVPEFMCVESIKMKGQGKTRYVNMPSTTSFERKLWMPDVVITTPETISTDDWMELSAVDWQCLVVDEAHKLKNVDSKLSQTLSRNEFNVDFKLTLTGTPLQNNTLELWSLLHFMDRLKFPLTAKKDAPGEIYSKERFEEQFHDADNTGKKLTMEGIHEIIGPYLLRRVKGDVEKTVPPKTETIIDCPMVMFQKMTYKAIYDRNMKLLASAELSAKQRKSKSKLNMPSLINVQMELRKCCNHTFLVAGAEQVSPPSLLPPPPTPPAQNLEVDARTLLFVHVCGPLFTHVCRPRSATRPRFSASAAKTRTPRPSCSRARAASSACSTSSCPSSSPVATACSSSRSSP